MPCNCRFGTRIANSYEFANITQVPRLAITMGISSIMKAKRVLPVHSGKFAMSNHAWDEPLKKVTELNQSAKLNVITPMIGEVVRLKDDQQKFSEWWKE